MSNTKDINAKFDLLQSKYKRLSEKFNQLNDSFNRLPQKENLSPSLFGTQNPKEIEKTRNQIKQSEKLFQRINQLFILLNK